MIPANELREAAKVAILAADLLLATSTEQKGPTGSELRRACGDMKSFAENYIVANIIGPKLSNCFSLARLTGATMSEFNRMCHTFAVYPEGGVIWDNGVVCVLGELFRDADNGRAYKCLVDHTSSATGSFSDDRIEFPENWGDPLFLPSMLIKNACVAFSLQQLSLVIINYNFTSREDVLMVRSEANAAFRQAEEVAADDMALTSYKALVALHAALVFHLYETARPLPQMLAYRFATPRPTLVMSHRLYDTAARADQLREENKMVHPAFAPREGRALAF